MSGSAGLDQQLVIHLFAPAMGPRAETAYGALRELWLGCRQFFLMREPIPGIGLPHQLPAGRHDFPGTAETGAEAALAAQERPDADCQAILRRHRDVLNLSVVLARPAGASSPGAGHSRWQNLDSQWSYLSDRLTGDLLGEARIYLARSAAPPGPPLDEALPAAARIRYWQHSRAAVHGGLALWEALPWDDGRALRRFVLAFAADDDADQLASAWAWSRGDTEIPPLARYLLHAAKLRYLYRVWQRDATAHEARFMSADLRELREAAEIAADNMGLVVSGPALLAPESPLADDRDLARSFLARLDDEVFYLGVAADRAAGATDFLSRHARLESVAPATGREPAPPPPSTAAQGSGAAGPAGADDITRNVFVVHGRDEEASGALFGFLEALGLRPLGWETLVAATGSASPYLRDVIMQGIAMAQAAVVLMTPDDVVWLHPSLHGADEDDHEAHPSMQARPNVILELGMALATYADRTIVLIAGKHRPMADLGGLNYIRLTDGDQCLQKIIRRLQTARCQVSDEPAVHARPWFGKLAAYNREAPR